MPMVNKIDLPNLHALYVIGTAEQRNNIGQQNRDTRQEEYFT